MGIVKIRVNMEEVGGSVSRERPSVLRENILAAWRFKAGGTDEMGSPKKGSEAWVAKASQRDMEILTRALQRELNSRPTDAASIITDSDDAKGADHSHNLSSDVASSCCPRTDRLRRPGIQPSPKCAHNYDQNSHAKIGKKRARGSNKSPVTILKADPANFREMVQRVTSVDMNSMRTTNAIHERASNAPVLRPQPKRPSPLNYIPGLPTLDTSSSLNAADPPAFYHYYLDQLVNNNTNNDNGADDRPRMMRRLGLEPTGDFVVSPNSTDCFFHHESLKFGMNQHPALLPLDFSISSPQMNNKGDAGKFIPLRALNIGFANQTISAESDEAAFAAPGNPLLTGNY